MARHCIQKELIGGGLGNLPGVTFAADFCALVGCRGSHATLAYASLREAVIRRYLPVYHTFFTKVQEKGSC